MGACFSVWSGCSWFLYRQREVFAQKVKVQNEGQLGLCLGAWCLSCSTNGAIIETIVLHSLKKCAVCQSHANSFQIMGKQAPHDL